MEKQDPSRGLWKWAVLMSVVGILGIISAQAHVIYGVVGVALLLFGAFIGFVWYSNRKLRTGDNVRVNLTNAE
jgi:hypothetical protein